MLKGSEAMRIELPSTINGWFAVAYSHEIAPAAVRVVDYMERPVAIFRTESGQLSAADAFCPHLGASLATMATVQGEELVCTAHGFRFDRAGACTHAYGRAAANVRLPTFHLREQQGVVFLWYHHEGAPPAWELPEIGEPRWSAPRHRSMQLATHPQEVVENAVDVGHFEGVHGLSAAAPASMHCEEHRLSTAGTFTTRGLLPIEKLRVSVRFGFEAFGLGFARSEAYVPQIDLRLRAYAASTPRGDGTSDVRCWTQVYEPAKTVRRIPRLGRALPAAVSEFLISKFWDTMFSRDFAKDIRYWTSKRYLARPSLARLDPYIGPYRKWALQFYPPTRERAYRLPQLAASAKYV